MMEEPIKESLVDKIRRLRESGGLSAADEERALALNIQNAQLRNAINQIPPSSKTYEADIAAFEKFIERNTEILDGIISAAESHIEATKDTAPPRASVVTAEPPKSSGAFVHVVDPNEDSRSGSEDQPLANPFPSTGSQPKKEGVFAKLFKRKPKSSPKKSITVESDSDHEHDHLLEPEPKPSLADDLRESQKKHKPTTPKRSFGEAVQNLFGPKQYQPVGYIPRDENEPSPLPQIQEAKIFYDKNSGALQFITVGGNNQRRDSQCFKPESHAPNAPLIVVSDRTETEAIQKTSWDYTRNNYNGNLSEINIFISHPKGEDIDLIYLKRIALEEIAKKRPAAPTLPKSSTGREPMEEVPKIPKITTATIYYNNDTEFEWRYIQIGEEFYVKRENGKIDPAPYPGMANNMYSKTTPIKIPGYDPTKEINFVELARIANGRMAWLKKKAKEHESPLETSSDKKEKTDPSVPLISDFDTSDDDESTEEESAARIPAPVSGAVSHTDTGYHITAWLKKYEGAINHYAGRVSQYKLRDDYQGFKKEIRGFPHNVKVNDNGTFESDFIHADSPLAASISANVFILALQTYAVIYAKSGKSDAALPEGDIIFRLNPRDLDPRHLRVYDEFSADVEKKVMNWVKSRPKGFPKEVLSKCKFIRPDGTKIDLNPSATPKRTAETSGDELIARKKVKPNPAPAADSSSPDVTPLRSPRGR